MSSPVNVQCKVVSLAILEKAALDCGFNVSRSASNDKIDSLHIDMGISYGKVTATIDPTNNISVVCDDVREDLFRKQLLARYNMYQIKENWEQSGQYIFNDNWLTVREDETLELNCERKMS